MKQTRRPSPSDPRTCRNPGCGTTVILAVLAPTPVGAKPRWAAFEARDRVPFSAEAAGARVIVADRQAWRPTDLIEDYRVRHELTESAARELVSGFPFHRIHTHLPEKEHQPVKEINPS